MLSDEEITKFQTLYKKRFGEKISREQALKEGIQLILLMKHIYRPMTQEEYDKYSQNE